MRWRILSSVEGSTDSQWEGFFEQYLAPPAARQMSTMRNKQDAILDKLPGISNCRLVADSDIDSLSPTNIVLIVADDLGYEELGSYGQATIKTPELDMHRFR